VYKIKDKYYLYYTASPRYSPRNSGNHVGLAISDKIEGPYEDVGRVVKHASIDGHLYTDADGSMYFFYTIEHLNEDSLTAGQIYMDKMISPTQLEGNPKQIISHHRWQEGPCLQLHEGKYYLTYSCGAWTNHTYHVRYAIADSPEGPFTEQPEKLLESNEMVIGPGHHAMFTDLKGRDWIVYHGWDTAHTARYPRIDRIYFEDDKIKCNGPTYTEQKVE
jgi:beta-xylosidase